MCVCVCVCGGGGGYCKKEHKTHYSLHYYFNTECRVLDTSLHQVTHNLVVQVRAAIFNGHWLERHDTECNGIGGVETVVVDVSQLVNLNLVRGSFGPHHR